MAREQREDAGQHERTRRPNLYNNGICPVCGEEFIDGYDQLKEMESYDGKICVTDVDGKGSGHMLVHLDDV